LTNSTIKTPTRKPHTLAFLSKTIRHDTFLDAFTAIENSHKTTGFNPKSMFLVGPSGAGKSTIVKKYVDTYRPRKLKEYTYIPIVYISLDERATTKDALSLLLGELQDVAPSNGDVRILRRRLENYIISCKVELIIIDEIHHVLPAHTTAKTQEFADWIKSIMDKTSIPFIFVGLPESIKLLHAISKADEKDQLFRRSRRTVEIKPPEPNTVIWKKLITGYQRALGEVQCINLSSPEMLARLYLATKGLNGRVANLLSEALELIDDKEMLTLIHLSQAYLEANPTFDAKKNPFDLSLREVQRYIKSTDILLKP
jgi:Cdc6-like AAA superfamily ATPase